jgi:hypothetical protein
MFNFDKIQRSAAAALASLVFTIAFVGAAVAPAEAVRSNGTATFAIASLVAGTGADSNG